ncbi:MAG TPA: hypothetical protein VN285_06045 [Candidatus Deferrimicrobium sp.]|nr:hypothetical protein [Candidatus Deferrimicrobium sp.]
MRIFAGNLAFDVIEDDLRTAFEPFGQVDAVSIVKERMSGESRGFAFVDMPVQREAKSAIDGLNGKDFKGRNMNVNEARPMPQSSFGSRPFSSDRSGGSRRRDGRRRRTGGKPGRKPRFSRHSY